MGNQMMKERINFGEIWFFDHGQALEKPTAFSNSIQFQRVKFHFGAPFFFITLLNQ